MHLQFDVKFKKWGVLRGVMIKWSQSIKGQETAKSIRTPLKLFRGLARAIVVGLVYRSTFMTIETSGDSQIIAVRTGRCHFITIARLYTTNDHKIHAHHD